MMTAPRGILIMILTVLVMNVILLASFVESKELVKLVLKESTCKEDIASRIALFMNGMKMSREIAINVTVLA
jgi:hypothetical protein